MKHSRSTAFYVIHIVGALAFGTLVYLFFRRDAYISKYAERLFPLPRISWEDCPQPLLRFVRFYLADIAWAYALAFSVGGLLIRERNGLWLTLGICGSFVLLVELLQKGSVLPGTFDWADIAWELAATVSVLIIIKKHLEVKHEKSS